MNTPTQAALAPSRMPALIVILVESTHALTALCAIPYIQRTFARAMGGNLGAVTNIITSRGAYVIAHVLNRDRALADVLAEIEALKAAKVAHVAFSDEQHPALTVFRGDAGAFRSLDAIERDAADFVRMLQQLNAYACMAAGSVYEE